MLLDPRLDVDELKTLLRDAVTARQAVRQMAAERQRCLRRAVQDDDWNELAEICTADLLAVRTFSREETRHLFEPEYPDQWWGECLSCWSAIRSSSLLAEELFEELQATARTRSGRWEPQEILGYCSFSSRCAHELEQSGELDKALATHFSARAWMRVPPLSAPAVRGTLSHIEGCIAQAYLDRDHWPGALDACRRIEATGSPVDPDLMRLAREKQGLGLLESGRPVQAAAALEEALALLPGEEQPSLHVTHDRARLEKALAKAYLQSGDRHRGVAHLRRALQSSTEVSQMDASPQHEWEVALSLGNLGRQLLYEGFPEQALEMCLESREMLRRSDSTQTPEAMAFCERDIGQALEELGRSDEALASYGRALQIWETLEQTDPGQWQVERATTLCSTSLIKRDWDVPAALEEQLRALQLLRGKVLAEDELHHLGLVWANLCSTFLLLRRYSESLAAFRQARQSFMAGLQAFPAAASTLARLESNFAPILALQGHDDEAREVLECARRRYEALIARQGRLDLKEELAICLLRLENPLVDLEEG